MLCKIVVILFCLGNNDRKDLYMFDAIFSHICMIYSWLNSQMWNMRIQRSQLCISDLHPDSNPVVLR
jgi:hypothetical protein